MIVLLADRVRIAAIRKFARLVIGQAVGVNDLFVTLRGDGGLAAASVVIVIAFVSECGRGGSCENESGNKH